MKLNSESDSLGESGGLSFCLGEHTEAFEEEGTGAILAAARACASLMEALLFLVRVPSSTIIFGPKDASGSRELASVYRCAWVRRVQSV